MKMMTAELKVSVTIYTMNELVCIQINSNIQTNMREKKIAKISCVVLFLYQRHLKSIYLELQIFCM